MFDSRRAHQFFRHLRNARKCLFIWAHTAGHMDAWQRVTGNRLAPWQVDALLAMDAAFLAAQPKQGKQGRK